MKVDDKWQEREQVFLAFEAAWSRDTPPAIDPYLEDVPEHDRSGLLAELVMIDFEHRCRQGLVATLDSYFDQYPSLLNSQAVRDELLRHELQVRGKVGQLPTLQELETRFPGDTKVIALRDSLGTLPEPARHISSMVRAGTMVNDYCIEGCAGSGTFATVFRATDQKLQRRVALKFLSHSDELRPEWRLRMVREAQAVASLEHPNVVQVYETGQFRGHDFIATRFVNGKTLDQLVQDEPLSLEASVEVVRQLAAALEHAHQRGVVHRDIKPANIMMEADVPLLVDFGLAHFLDASESLTHDGDLVGTPAFMSPEQADGRARVADGRSDVYSLGAVLYSLVCRRLPFEGTTAEIIGKLKLETPTAPRDVNSAISRDLETIVLKCLQTEPSDRYQTAGELLEDLDRYVAGVPIHARPIGLLGRCRSWSRRRPVVATLVAGVAGLLIFLGSISTQLYRVSGERNKARDDGRETQALLAESAVSAGELAMQRGRMDDSVHHFEQALARGAADRPAILLKLVEANVSRRNIDEAAAHWALANEENTESELLAPLALWRAELALEGRDELGDGESLMREARELRLPVDEQYYVDGVLAESSPAAVAALRKATEHNPFHHRARRLLAFMLLSLARLDEAAIEIRIARQQFPEDVDFLLLDSLVHAASRDPDGAVAMLEGAALGAEELDHGGSFVASCTRPLFRLLWRKTSVRWMRSSWDCYPSGSIQHSNLSCVSGSGEPHRALASGSQGSLTNSPVC